MHLNLRLVLELLTVLATLASLSFYLLSEIGIISFLGDRRRKIAASQNASQLPPVSILKPLKGVDPEIWESFCSHCEQEYPEFELIFGVSDPADPACDVVRRLQTKYPARTIELVVCERLLGANVKVSNLAQMAAKASYEVLLVNDSDIRVERDYLRRVITPLADEQVGLVTCLYRANPTNTIGSRLEALGISTDFTPGVLSARFLEKGLHFGLGSTLAFRRSNLEAIGGFESFVDYLADDYELGRRIAATGKRIELSAATVETFLPFYTLAKFWQHQLRWSRTIRDARPLGYFGLIFTFGPLWSLAALIVSGGAGWAWTLFLLTTSARLIVSLHMARAVLHDRHLANNLFLLPLRDLIAPIVWAAALVGNRIHWRGDDFFLKDGRLSRIPSGE